MQVRVQEQMTIMNIRRMSLIGATLLVVIVVSAIAYSVIFPGYTASPREGQVAFLGIRGETSALREKIEIAARKKGTLDGVAKEMRAEYRGLSGKYVSDVALLEDGTLAIKARLTDSAPSPAQAVWVLLIPQFTSGSTIEWRCIGYPKGILVRQCE